MTVMTAFFLNFYLLILLFEIYCFPVIGLWFPAYSALLLACYLMLYFSVRDVNRNQRIAFVYLFIVTIIIIRNLIISPHWIGVYAIIFVKHVYLQGVLGAGLLQTKKEGRRYLLPVSIAIFMANIYVIFAILPREYS